MQAKKSKYAKHQTNQFVSIFRRYGTSGLSSAAGSSSGGSDLARSRSSHALKVRDASPLRSATATTSNDDKDGAALSSWARYLKNKYGQV